MVRFCQVLFSLVQNLGVLVQGAAGGFELVGGEPVLAQQGDHDAAVLAVEPHDVRRGDLADERGGAVVFDLGVLEQRLERVRGGELAQLLGGVFEPLKGVGVGEGLDDLGEGFVEEAEVGVDRGAGDVELLGDLAQGVSALFELAGLEDALASFGGEGHGVSFCGTGVLIGMVAGLGGCGSGLGEIPAAERGYDGALGRGVVELLWHGVAELFLCG